MGWEVNDCMEKFVRFAIDTLGQPGSRPTSTLSRVRQLTRALFTGGTHDAQVVAAALQECFGSDVRLFGPSSNGPSGQKIVITATTLHGSSAVIFDNYNPHETVPRSSAYRRAGRQPPEEEPMLWEV